MPNQFEINEIIQNLIDSTHNDSFSNMPAEKQIDILSSNQDISECLSSCSNNGVCKFSNGQYACQCFPDYIGSICQTNSRPCSHYPCLNKGVCIDVLNEEKTILTKQHVWDFTCNCSQFYYGQRCELKINVCQNETCSGNGHCFDNTSVATCNCFLYFSGDKCQIQDRKLKIIKNVITVAAIIAIVVICLVFSFFFLMDLSKLISRHPAPKKKMTNKKSPGKKFKKNVPVNIRHPPEYIP